MSLKTKVKISQVTNLSDARYCAGMGVQYLGFNFVSNHEFFIEPARFMEIKSWITGPEMVGEFEGSEISRIRELPCLDALDLIEINKPGNLQELSLLGKPAILKLNLPDYGSMSALESDLQFAKDLVEYFLLDHTGDEALDPAEALTLSNRFPIFLGFGIHKENIHQLIRNSRLLGIALRGGKEEKVGFKDYEVLADILEELEME